MWSKSVFQTALVALLVTPSLVSAHTWIEQLMVIAPNGTMIGNPGFPRGNILRNNPSFNDPAMVNIIPPNGRTINQIFANDPMCKSSQQAQTQTGGSPRLQAFAGAAVALRFQENGHVSLPGGQPGKPDNRGTVYVYGTTDPKPTDNFLDIHRVWNADGTGGDRRGVLLSSQNYDDGQCYQVNSGPISQQRQKTFAHQANSLMGGDLWCQQDIALPSNIPAGKTYTLYWVWDWPTLPGTPGFPEGKQEIYTTCMDVDVVQSTSLLISMKAVGNVNFLKGQSLNNAAIASQLNDITNPTAVVGKAIPFSSAGKVQATVSPGNFVTAASSVASVSTPSTVSSAKSSNPVFLSAHTASTNPLASATRSLIRQTATIQPIPASTSKVSGNPGSSASGSTVSKIVQPTTTASRQSQPSPKVTASASVVSAGSTGSNGRKVVTVTEVENVTETVYTTVHRAKQSKRADAENVILATAASTDAAVYRLRARNPFYPIHVGYIKPTSTPSTS